MKNFQENFSTSQEKFFKISLIARNFLNVVTFQFCFQSVFQRYKKNYVKISNQFYKNTITESGLWLGGAHFEN